LCLSQLVHIEAFQDYIDVSLLLDLNGSSCSIALHENAEEIAQLALVLHLEFVSQLLLYFVHGRKVLTEYNGVVDLNCENDAVSLVDIQTGGHVKGITCGTIRQNYNIHHAHCSLTNMTSPSGWIVAITVSLRLGSRRINS
jgi:hypothetical protein